MRILMVGDVVGKPGREATLEWVPTLKAQHQVDFVIVNAENAAGGIGITPELANTLLERGGIQVLTLGNHAWGKREIYPYLETECRLLRPANYPPGAPGKGWGVYPSPAGPDGGVAPQDPPFMAQTEKPFS